MQRFHHQPDRTGIARVWQDVNLINLLCGQETPTMTFTMAPQSILIQAEPVRVWEVLTDPALGEAWRGAIFDTDWRPGSRIDITALIGDERYRDRGQVLASEAPRLLSYTYWSRVSGLPDAPEGCSIVTIDLERNDSGTMVTVRQDVPPSPVTHGAGWVIDGTSGLKHVEFYWRMSLPRLKMVAEGLLEAGLSRADGPRA